MEAWLHWARGPLFWAALTFMAVGLARLVALTVWEIGRVVSRAGDKNIPSRQLLVATLKWLFPTARLKDRWLFSLTTLVFHISIILVPIFLAGHIVLWQRGTGLWWPAMPNGLATLLTVAAVVAALALVVERITSRDSRILSRFRDYALPLVIAVPFASGFLVMHPGFSPFPYEGTLLAHVVSANVLLVLIPLTKLSHMVLLPATQVVSELAWFFPSDAGRKVAMVLEKVGEPI